MTPAEGVGATSPSRDELLRLLREARSAVEASQGHWGAVRHLTGDRRYQRQQQEVLRLLDAMRQRVEAFQD